MRFLNILILILLGCNSTNAQEAKWNEVVIEDDISSAFEKTLDFLMEREFFIENADKESGFIRAKRYIKNKKIISFKYGDIFSVSLLLRTAEPESTKIKLQIYVTEQYISDDGGANYKDIGLSKKEENYRVFLKGLTESMR